MIIYLYKISGGNPYPGVEINEKFLGLLKSGYRMEKPKFASEDVYVILDIYIIIFNGNITI